MGELQTNPYLSICGGLRFRGHGSSTARRRLVLAFQELLFTVHNTILGYTYFCSKELVSTDLRLIVYYVLNTSLVVCVVWESIITSTSVL
jgi:hypothetical protein